jgi:hypothetical protein
MKKISLLSIGMTFGIVSLSAYANPPVVDGTWVGTYTVLNGSSCEAGQTGAATLTQQNATADPVGDTKFNSILTLQNIKITNPDPNLPPFTTGIAGQTTITLQGGGGVYINQGMSNYCSSFTSPMFAYDDATQKITNVVNSSDASCTCHISLTNLVFNASKAIRK